MLRDKPTRFFVGIWFEKLESGNAHFVSPPVSGRDVFGVNFDLYRDYDIIGITVQHFTGVNLFGNRGTYLDGGGKWAFCDVSYRNV